MDEHPDTALHYGHMGRAVYVPDTHSWAFTRSLKRPYLFSNTGLTRTTVPSPLVGTQRQRFIEHLPAAGQGLIPKVLPDLAVEWSSVRNDSFSRLITNTTRRYDPQVSTLLDIGHADPAQEDLNVRYSVPIAAAVTGECGNSITFRVLSEEDVHLDGPPPLHIPCIGDSDVSEWSRRGAPILQVSFARALEEDPHWLAARLPDATVIFRPRLFRRETVPMYVPDNDLAALSAPRRNSPLDANPVVEISISQTGGSPHADVTFNPWYPRQFGIIDIEGYWSIWEITGHHRKRKSAFAAKCLKRGSLPWMDHTQDPNGPQYDGWASIEWIGDVSTVLVSDRRCVMVSQIFDEDSQSYQVELGLTLESEWVLQVRRSARNTSHFFVLTTTRLLWFDIASVQRNARGEPLPLKSRLAWRHFRDSEDTTLRLCDVSIGEDSHIILYSRLTSLVQTFQVQVNDEQIDSDPIPDSAPDSILLDIPSTIDVSPLGEISHMHYSTFVFRQIDYVPIQSAAECERMTLVKLFWSDSSFAVHETLFRGPDQKDEEDEFAEGTNTSHIHLLSKKTPHPRRSKHKHGDHDFVVDDWDESTYAPPRAGRKLARNREKKQVDFFDPEWTLDMTNIYEDLVTNLNKNNADSSRPTLRHLTKELQNNTLSTLADWKSTETMLELSESRPLIDDIDEGAEELAGLVATAVRSNFESQNFTILPLHFSKLFHGVPNIQGTSSGLDYLDTYEELVTEWVKSLPRGSGIPDKTRILKEKMIREITLDLCLARLIRTSVSDTPISSQQKPDSQTQTQTSTKPPKSSQGTAISLLSSSQLLPSSQTHPSSLPASSAPNPDPSTPAQQPLFTNLSAYTTFNKKAPASKISKLLSHWTPSTDPSTYEWSKTTQLLDEDSQSQSQSATPRRKRSRSRSTAPTGPAVPTLSQPTTTPSTPLPPTPVAPMIRASQPTRPASAVKSFLFSSQPTLADSSQAPMTQTERGPFGTRDKKGKGKKKRRAAGF